jgi:predicted DNA-binding transcriptional regulator YafY
MRRADRLIELVGHLRAGGLLTAERLAAALEVSVRTVYRDIAALQAQGLPIEGAAGIGYLLRAPLDLPPLTFDHDELEALALGLDYVTQVGDPGLAAAARAARAKIDVAWADAPAGGLEVRRLSARQRPAHRAPAIAAALRLAVREHRLVEFGYRNAEGEATRRTVRPLALTAFSEGWLLIAWCELRDDFRVFRLDRISACRLLDGGFVETPGQDLATFLALRERPRARG